MLCLKCEKEKQINDFYSNSKTECKECVKKRVLSNPNAENYDKTEKGVIRVIYKTQKSNSKRRGHEPPSYTKEQLREWLYKNNFKKLYDNWVKSGYKKYKKPSVDRIDDFKHYSLDNIRLGTWMDNKNHQTQDILNSKETSGLRCKKILQFDSKMKLIGTFVSYSSAKRSVGYSFEKVINTGRQDRTKGSIWYYEEFLTKKQ